MQVCAHIVKSFTKDKDQGNPAGVIPDSDALSTAQMFSISQQLGFSESVFIQKSKKADFKLRFFSPTQEVDLCAHATIAAIHVLAEAGRVKRRKLSVETAAGAFSVSCEKDGMVIMSQEESKYLYLESDKKKIARLLNIKEKDILPYPIQIVSVGTPKLIIPVSSLDVLFSIEPDFEGIKEYCRKSGARGFYPFTFETKEKNSDFHARQFNPLAGINEDPVTGVAAGALCAYIKHHKVSSKYKFIIEQGYCMNKAGKIIVQTNGGIKVGGYATESGIKKFDV